MTASDPTPTNWYSPFYYHASLYPDREVRRICQRLERITAHNHHMGMAWRIERELIARAQEQRVTEEATIDAGIARARKLVEQDYQLLRWQHGLSLTPAQLLQAEIAAFDQDQYDLMKTIKRQFFMHPDRVR